MSAILSPRSNRAEPQIFSPCRVAGPLAKKVEFSQIGRVWDELVGELARVAILPAQAEYIFKRPKLRFDSGQFSPRDQVVTSPRFFSRVEWRVSSLKKLSFPRLVEFGMNWVGN